MLQKEDRAIALKGGCTIKVATIPNKMDRAEILENLNSFCLDRNELGIANLIKEIDPGNCRDPKQRAIADALHELLQADQESFIWLGFVLTKLGEDDTILSFFHVKGQEALGCRRY